MNKFPLFSAGTDRHFFAVAFRFLSAVLLAFAPAAVLCAGISNLIDPDRFSSEAAGFSPEQKAAFLVKRGEFSGNTPTLDISAAQIAPALSKAVLKAAERKAPGALTRIDLAEIGARELTSSDLDWRETPSGKRVAQFVMTVEGTASFRFVLDLKGVGFGTAMRYLGGDPNKQIFLPQVLEPSSASEIAQIWSPHIQGDQVTVEIATLPANEKLLSFAIKTVLVAPPASVGVSKALASCAQDVACGASAITWQQSAGAVYISSSEAQCSATLLADSRGTRTPFLLTAAHCGVGEQEVANSLSVDYYYRATTCGGATDQFQRITQPGGAAVIYTDPSNDEVLLELRQAPPASVPFLSYYGYDRGVPTGGTGLPVLGLSYPDGAREKLSGGAAFLRTGDLTTTPTRAGFVIHLNSWYHVPWSYGVTQPGSSGSGLFEETPNGLRLLGVDSAGSTLDVSLMCSPEYRYASYSRFDLSWPKMSHWLSPSIPANTAPIIAVEDYPYFIGVNARNNQLVVTHTGAQAAYVINGNTDHIYGKIETYAKPLFAAWNGATNTIYISDQQPYVLVVDGATLKVTARVAGYPNSNWIAVNELTNKTYVSSTTVAGILIVDGNNPNFTDAIPVPVPAIGMAIDAPKNRLYVAGAPGLIGDGGLYVVDMAQKKVLNYVPTGQYPYSVVLDALSNRAFVNNANSQTVSVVDLTTMTVVKTIATGNSPVGMTYNATTREVWVAAAIGGRITIVNAAILTEVAPVV